mmetsp:Transcript_107495/g.314284  ORF Transcript_107495/g.314284 Transcript_107495/m.314284 type:complete len:257 (-) Transcript_107495:13-783(-)
MPPQCARGRAGRVHHDDIRPACSIWAWYWALLGHVNEAFGAGASSAGTPQLQPKFSVHVPGPHAAPGRHQRGQGPGLPAAAGAVVHRPLARPGLRGKRHQLGALILNLEEAPAPARQLPDAAAGGPAVGQPEAPRRLRRGHRAHACSGDGFQELQARGPQDVGSQRHAAGQGHCPTQGECGEGTQLRDPALGEPRRERPGGRQPLGRRRPLVRVVEGRGSGRCQLLRGVWAAGAGARALAPAEEREQHRRVRGGSG